LVRSDVAGGEDWSGLKGGAKTAPIVGCNLEAGACADDLSAGISNEADWQGGQQQCFLAAPRLLEAASETTQ
jgi:hypothetical protein